MSIDIIEIKTGFKCNLRGKERKYQIGESLVELSNFDFNQLRYLLDNFKETDNLTYEDYFANIFKLYSKKNETTSIHFELLKNTLRNFYDNYDDGNFESDCKPFPYSTIPNQKQLNGEIKTFFSSLFSMQYKIRKIFSCLAECKDKNKIQVLADLEKNEKIKNEDEFQKLGNTSIFNFTPRDINPIYNDHDKMVYKPPLFKSNEINFPLHFSEVETFCFYELRRLLNSSINIICCPICNKFVASKDKRKKYCSNTCKGKAFENNSEQTAYYKLYRTRYKYLHNYYSEHNDVDGTIPQEIKSKLKSLYDKYKNKDEDDKKIIEKYKLELNKIK